MTERLLIMLELVILRYAQFELRMLGTFEQAQNDQLDDLFEAAFYVVLSRREL